MTLVAMDPAPPRAAAATLGERHWRAAVIALLSVRLIQGRWGVPQVDGYAGHRALAEAGRWSWLHTFAQNPQQKRQSERKAQQARTSSR